MCLSVLLCVETVGLVWSGLVRSERDWGVGATDHVGSLNYRTVARVSHADNTCRTEPTSRSLCLSLPHLTSTLTLTLTFTFTRTPPPPAALHSRTRNKDPSGLWAHPAGNRSPGEPNRSVRSGQASPHLHSALTTTTLLPPPSAAGTQDPQRGRKFQIQRVRVACVRARPGGWMHFLPWLVSALIPW